MKDESYFIERAKEAYDAYGAVTDHKNYQGLPMPEWDDLTEKIRAAWVEAVKSVYRTLQVKDETGELFLKE